VSLNSRGDLIVSAPGVVISKLERGAVVYITNQSVI
jgi:hypothetical protein